MRHSFKQSLFLSGMLLLLAESVSAAPEFTPDSQPTGWVSRPVVTFFDLSSGTQAFYQLDYRKDTWAGNVLAYDVNSTARIQTTGPWDNADPTVVTAASLLNSANFSSGRKIATTDRAFRWASLTGAQQTAIGSEAILNFVRGDRSNEEPNGLSLYQRESVIGDIMHSTIYYWNDGTNETLYVGANDGMLHSFDAKTGAENFAFIPSILMPKLKKLANKPYVHTHFVDGPISIANMQISNTRKTILVSGLGAGGAGLFALDVTAAKPSNESAVVSKVLWEITATGSFANLGHTYGTPQLTRLNNGTAAVIIGNGYVNAGNGHAVLYIINANTGALISAIDTGSGSAASPNGLSSPALYDTNGDGTPEYVYAGDIDGHLWKFDLSNNSSSIIFSTFASQAITSAPVVHAHPLGGQMVAFATGRILTSGDQDDASVHYAYGIWDGAPSANNQLQTQSLTASASNGATVRTVSNNPLDWSAGSGHHKGWKVALPSGERVVGEMPFYNNGRFYFLSTNPSLETGENWLHELVFNTGGSPAGPIFDLNEDGLFNDSDLAANGHVPVAKYLGVGVFSQPRLVRASGLATTLYAFHPDLPIENGVPTPPDDPGVSGGHFDFDIYYFGDSVTEIIAVPTADSETDTICKKTKDIQKELDKVARKACVENPDISSDYTYLTNYITGAKCGGKDNYQTVTCNKVIMEEITSADYRKVKHEHEYDDKYDVTGVNMLNPSLTDFDLKYAITDPDTQFKILVMNQYINPAAKLSVGGADYESVKTYEDLASTSNAQDMLDGLPTYTRATINTFIYNLPLDAFKSKDWWGDGVIRAGLIPTQTGCVNKVSTEGVVETPGPNGERFNGALTFQLIKPNTPPGHLELNGPDVSYGWRVKDDFGQHVLAEYTTFWHHPNHECYDDAGWVPDPPEDFVSDAKAKIPNPGSADPTDGVFGEGLSFTDVTTTVGNVTTTVRTYSDGSFYRKTVTVNDDGSTTIYQEFRDGSTEVTFLYSGDGGHAGFVDPNTGSPEEEIGTGHIGRQTWRDMVDE